MHPGVRALRRYHLIQMFSHPFLPTTLNVNVLAHLEPLHNLDRRMAQRRRHFLFIIAQTGNEKLGNFQAAKPHLTFAIIAIIDHRTPVSRERAQREMWTLAARIRPTYEVRGPYRWGLPCQSSKSVSRHPLTAH
jgi:hypothetical protein